MWEKFATLISEISGLPSRSVEHEREEESERQESELATILIPDGADKRVDEEVDGSSSEG